MLSGHILGNSCSVGYPYVFFVLCLIVTLVKTHFGFEGWTLVLNALVPGHCLQLFFRSHEPLGSQC